MLSGLSLDFTQIILGLSWIYPWIIPWISSGYPKIIPCFVWLSQVISVNRQSRREQVMAILNFLIMEKQRERERDVLFL